MSNIASSFRSRSSSTASQEPQEGEELRVSISSLRSRFESLAAGSGVSGVGDGGIRKSASTAGRPDGQAAGKVRELGVLCQSLYQAILIGFPGHPSDPVKSIPNP